MKKEIPFVTPPIIARVGLILTVGITCLAALPGWAKDAPKLLVSDREVDRSAQGASYANAIKRVTPSVVTIVSTRTIQIRQFRSPLMEDPMFRRFFAPDSDSADGDNGRDSRDGRRGRKLSQESLGSGVVVTEDGYILTNNHVIEGADEDGITVRMPDGKTKYEAKVVGRDPRTDIAVLKIDAAKKLPAITLADSDKLEVGDVVLAVGNPFGVGQSVSSGIVSALGRGFGMLGQGGYEDFIQTDASINKGNSGGALVDAEGRLIGINQSIFSPSGGNAGVGFAVPVNLARSVMERLVTDGKIVRGYLGVSLQTVTPELAEAFQLSETTGALVGGVQPNTPAAKAGMQAGDVIVDYNGKAVTDSAHLRILVAQTPPQTPVTFKAIRKGKEKSFNITLAELPDDLVAGGNDSGRSGGNNLSALSGVETSDLDRQTRRRYDIPGRITGALVTKVDEDSAAANAGLRPGDVIVEFNRKPVRNADDVAELAGEAKGKNLLLQIYSQADGLGTTRFISVPAGKK